MRTFIRRVSKVVAWVAAIVVVLFALGHFFEFKDSNAVSVSEQVASGLAEGYRNLHSDNPDADIYETERERLEGLKAARERYNVAFSQALTWPESRLRTNKSPVLDYFIPKDVALQDGEQPRLRLLIIKSDDESQQWIDYGQAMPEGWEPVYWLPELPLRVEYATVERIRNLPTEVVMASQRSADGLFYLNHWIMREDVELSDTYLARAKWGRSILRSGAEFDGKRQIIDRYIAVLKRGQTSERLIYRPPSLEGWEEKGGYKRCWRLRASDATLLVDLNGQVFVFERDKNTNTSEVERDDGSVILEVTLGQDAEAQEVPVEFVYYRELKTDTLALQTL